MHVRTPVERPQNVERRCTFAETSSIRENARSVLRTAVVYLKLNCERWKSREIGLPQ